MQTEEERSRSFIRGRRNRGQRSRGGGRRDAGGRGRNAGRRPLRFDSRLADLPDRRNESAATIDPAVDPSIEDRTEGNCPPDRSVPPGLFYDRAACGFAGQFPIRVVSHQMYRYPSLIVP